MWAGFWEAVGERIDALVAWLGRMWVGGFKGVKVVLDSTWTTYVPPQDEYENPLMRLEVWLHVTNSSRRSLQLLRANLKKEPDRLVTPSPDRSESMPGILLWTEFQNTGILLPGDTGKFRCQFFTVLRREASGGVRVTPWEYRSRIVLTDQFGRKHRTKKLTWRH
jgi:hypothetical protein